MSLLADTGVLNGAVPELPAGCIRDPSAAVVTTTIASLMGPATPAVHAADSLVAAARKLRAHATDAVLVHGDDRAFIGMITRGDIIDQCVANGGDPAQVSAGSLVSTPTPYATPEQDAGSSVIETILRHRTSFLPVVDDGQLVGIITLDSLAVHLVDGMDDPDIDGPPEVLPELWPAAEPSPREEMRRRA